MKQIELEHAQAETKPTLTIRHLGRIDYLSSWQAMLEFTANRSSASGDELWCCEHPAVYTLGLAGKAEHLLQDIGIPLIASDRGGQITYHGPGQVVIYLLLDLNRRQLKVRELVARMEQAVIKLLAKQGVSAVLQAGAPGVYIRQSDADEHNGKIAALGLRVKKGCCYHGLSLNVDMDLTPFKAINPCGYAGMPVTQTRDLGLALTPKLAAEALIAELKNQLEDHEKGRTE
ncbi:MAG: lipoyl(octanoyl) transferase LipB [Pseudomonadota bacterium]